MRDINDLLNKLKNKVNNSDFTELDEITKQINTQKSIINEKITRFDKNTVEIELINKSYDEKFRKLMIMNCFYQKNISILKISKFF
ncbi:hypothetical protein KQ878_03495 [Mycoplasma zalophidermidis]|uniref:Uncharacterized protein n=1 Tax=Mycoplasma zalophidermidis TaxID=398174 RepID=A0ABS6DSD3_9MOLU|nr:hypothetical protein [Mycoplasma zalophidermidis]